MPLSYQQSKLVQSTLPALREHGEQVTELFYATMLEEHPELRPYFNPTNQYNGRQPRALTVIILAFAANISHTSEIVPRLERACQKHCSLSIQPQQYAVVGEYLIRAFREVLGPAMTDDVQAAWTEAYCVLARMMIGRELHLYRDFGHWQGWRPMRIERKVAETEDIYSFYLVPAGPPAGSPPPSSAGPGTGTNSAATTPADVRTHGSLRASAMAKANPARLLRPHPPRTTSSTLQSLATQSSLSLHSVGSTSTGSAAANTGLPRYKPGQYVSVRVPLPLHMLATDSDSEHAMPSHQARQYSLSDCWRPDSYRITVKRDVGTRFANAVATSYLHPGVVSNTLIDHIEVGDVVDISHPAGDFGLDVDGGCSDPLGPLVLVSAGVGAAPMLAILAAVAASQPRRPVTYVHGTRCAPPVFDSQIAALQRKLPQLRVANFYTGGCLRGHAPSPAPSRTGSAVSAGSGPADTRTSPALGSHAYHTDQGAVPATHHFRGRIDLSKLVPGLADSYNSDSADSEAETRSASSRSTSSHSFSDSTATSPRSEKRRPRVTEDLLHLSSSSTQYLVCGPEPFMLDMAVRLVHGFGVNRNRIRYELFSTGAIQPEQEDSRMQYIRQGQ